jgi:hypothetical protein
MFLSKEKYSTEELNARLKFIIGVILGVTLMGIVFVVLYSIIFVTQPMNGISPVDNKFFELIIPIATFLTGTLSGIMLSGSSKEDKEAMLAAQKQATESFKTTMEEVKKPSKPVKSEPTLGMIPSIDQPVITGFGGKLAPPPAHQPEI